MPRPTGARQPLSLLLHSNDQMLLGTPTLDVGEALLAIAIRYTDHAGPWRSYVPPSGHVELTLAAASLTIGNTHDSAGGRPTPHWQPTIAGTELNDALRMSCSAGQALNSATLAAAFAGPRTTVSGAWWINEPETLNGFTAAELGAAAKQMVLDRFAPSLGDGFHRAGGLTGAAAQVRLVWTGQRICAPEMLTERERRLQPICAN